MTDIFPCIPSVRIDAYEGFLDTGKYPVLTVLSAGHALHVFVNGLLSGGQHNFGFQFFSMQLLDFFQ